MKKQSKHHYVPVFYLKAWTGTNGKLLTNIRDEGIVEKAIDQVAWLPYYNKFCTLSSAEVRTLLELVRNLGLPLGIARRMYELPRWPKGLAETPERKLGFEEIIGAIESRFSRLHQKALAGECIDGNDERSFSVIVSYLFLQHYRTPAYEKELLNAAGNLDAESKDSLLRITKYARFLLACSDADIAVLERSEWSVGILRCRNDAEFITGDAPVVCVPNEDVRERFYLPLSRNKALVLEHRQESITKPVVLTNGAVDELNRSVARQCEKYIFAGSKALLERYGFDGELRCYNVKERGDG